MPKNIVLLSDGTGNSSGSPFKTNVWRLYQAVDIAQPAPAPGPDQVVFYDDGVGTGNFRPLVMLGLALGIGLARNVKELYMFVCRNYEPGDNIYLFGFSRGAFTVRILAGLILRCGLVTAESDAELKERVKHAYAEYKRDVARRATATRPWLLAGHVLGWWRDRRNARIEFNFPQRSPRIRFVGVWDTVDAYGMPVDELKRGIDRYIWPMTLADRDLAEGIDRARHALSLDDERPTFRPVLWSDPRGGPPNRLKQVWFAGVHADIGGGYPDDGLANVTLQWMMDEAANAGLRLYPQHRMECDQRVNAHGEQHDSRAGLAGYYRYGPRSVDELCHDPDHGVLAEPRIHQSVIERINEWRVLYAPISFPCRWPYGVQQRGGGGPAPGAPLPETEAEAASRASDMDSVIDGVFRRRIAYFSTVVFTLVLAVLPAVDWLTGSASWSGGRSTALPLWSNVAQVVSAALTWVAGGGFLPGWTAPWVAAFARHPTIFLVAGSLVLWLFVRQSGRVQEQILARAEYAWRRL